jgi:hypothetical protein
MSATHPKIQIVGTYSVLVDDALIKAAMDIKYPLGMFSEKDREAAQPAVISEMSSAVLVEVIIEGADERYTADDFSQPDSEQAAYMETYLSSDGTSVISEYDRPSGDFLRVAFFLHDFNATKPLKTSYGEFNVRQPVPIPERLNKIVRYEPVG